MDDLKQQHVIVVDDEHAIRALMAETLEAPQRLVTTFETPMAALEFAAGNPVHVAILDLMMPSMTGIELAQRLKTLHPDCRVVICTGYLAENYEGLAQAEHVDRVLQKPFDVMELINLVNKSS